MQAKGDDVAALWLKSNNGLNWCKWLCIKKLITNSKALWQLGFSIDKQEEKHKETKKGNKKVRKRGEGEGILL